MVLCPWSGGLSRLAQSWLKKRDSKEKWLKSKYGLSLTEYNDLIRSQGGKCAICEKSPKSTQDYHVDHNHDTGQIRGLLCRGCNLGLGHFKESPENLTKAKIYLQKHKLLNIRIQSK